MTTFAQKIRHGYHHVTTSLTKGYVKTMDKLFGGHVLAVARPQFARENGQIYGLYSKKHMPPPGLIRNFDLEFNPESLNKPFILNEWRKIPDQFREPGKTTQLCCRHFAALYAYYKANEQPGQIGKSFETFQKIISDDWNKAYWAMNGDLLDAATHEIVDFAPVVHHANPNDFGAMCSQILRQMQYATPPRYRAEFICTTIGHAVNVSLAIKGDKYVISLYDCNSPKYIHKLATRTLEELNDFTFSDVIQKSGDISRWTLEGYFETHKYPNAPFEVKLYPVPYGYTPGCMSGPGSHLRGERHYHYGKDMADTHSEMISRDQSMRESPMIWLRRECVVVDYEMIPNKDFNAQVSCNVFET